jgi:hypothetical protein
MLVRNDVTILINVTDVYLDGSMVFGSDESVRGRAREKLSVFVHDEVRRRIPFARYVEIDNLSLILLKSGYLFKARLRMDLRFP